MIEGLAWVGKSYGDGAIKVEPRALEQLAIPKSLLAKYAIEVGLAEAQLSLLEPKRDYQMVEGSPEPGKDPELIGIIKQSLGG